MRTLRRFQRALLASVAMLIAAGTIVSCSPDGGGGENPTRPDTTQRRK